MTPSALRHIRVRNRRAWPSILMVAASSILMSACASPDDNGPSSEWTPPSSGPSESASTSLGANLRLLLSFDDAPVGPVDVGTVFSDSSTWENLAVAVYADSSDVRLEVVEDDDRGRVLSLSDPCSAEDEQCLRGILEVESTLNLDVGDSDFNYGAQVKMRESDLRDGANVLQKGYSTGGSGQWKLQVDDDKGLPECVLVGSGTDQVQKVKADRSVADDGWHSIVCRREGQSLDILIDGEPAGSADAMDRLIITNDNPIRIGGKHVKQGSDPTFGQIDDVFLSVN